jgi:hypothetical protein
MKRLAQQNLSRGNSANFRFKGAPTMPLDEMLKRNCIIDTSLLSNFVFTGYAHLLEKLVNGPVLIAPAVLDSSEITLPINQTVVPRCEFLKPLYEIHGTFSENTKQQHRSSSHSLAPRENYGDR